MHLEWFKTRATEPPRELYVISGGKHDEISLFGLSRIVLYLSWFGSSSPLIGPDTEHNVQHILKMV